MRYFTISALACCLCTVAPIAASARTGVPSTTDHLRQTTLTVHALPAQLDAIPRGVTRFTLLPLALSASCMGDVRVHSLRVHRYGPGDSADIKGVYALVSGRRLNRSTSFSSDDQTAVLRLRGLRIPACRTVRLNVAVDMERHATVGGRFALEVLDVGDIRTNADSVEGRFPLRTHEELPSVTPEPAGVIEVDFVSVGNIRTVRDELLAKFGITGAGNTHHLLYSITLTNTGTAKDDDLRNLYLTRYGGRALSPVVKVMDGKQVTFHFMRPYFIRKGQRVVFQVRGQAYTSSKTIAFTLEEPADLNENPTRRSGRRYDTQTRRLRSVPRLR
jgi:hypothetical protein